MKNKLKNACNEKDVENIYRTELLKLLPEAKITSPFKIDGLLEDGDIRTLLEFKYDLDLKSKTHQANVLIQILYYIKKFEEAGKPIPTTLFIGDKNECFALKTKAIQKYLLSEIDWEIAPSTAFKKNSQLLKAMVDDTNILPFVFDITETFSLKEVVSKIKVLSNNTVKKIKITPKNLTVVFDYFNNNVLDKRIKLETNEKVNLFVQLIINPSENYVLPTNNNVLVTSAFGKLVVNSHKFLSFFKHFEGQKYTAIEKEGLTSMCDRLIEDTIRRMKGEFYTPTVWVDEAHHMISDAFGSDWKERFIVWDCACGSGNLTRDYKFKELYCSTLEQSDLDTMNQMKYNPEACKFQFDFLNNEIESDLLDDNLKTRCPKLYENIVAGKEILFLINPPYGTSSNLQLGSSKKGVAFTNTHNKMKELKLGDSVKQLYAQFLYNISKIKNSKIAVFSPISFVAGQKFNKFREYYFKSFCFQNGMLFQASEFADVKSNWAIAFSTWNSSNQIKEKFPFSIKAIVNLKMSTLQKKHVYNVDKKTSLNKWARIDTKGIKQFDAPQLSTALNIKQKGYGKLCKKSLGYMWSCKNIPESNGTSVSLFTSTFSGSNSNGYSVFPFNFFKTTMLFSARKLIRSNWMNHKDEYIAPSEAVQQSIRYKQFNNDSIVYSLFNNSSQQSSLRQIEYNQKLWNIKNEFFWMDIEKLKQTAIIHNFDDVYRDAKTDHNRFVFNKLQNLYLSPIAQKVLDTAIELTVKSFEFRQILHNEHPEYHLNTWDAGYAQLKLIWKLYYKEEFKDFRNLYKELEDFLRPQVYELGFLLKENQNP